MQPQNPPFQVPQFNWLYFKPEFSGKPEEDAVVHFIEKPTTGWKPTTFHRKQRNKDFCLTLTGEARL